MVPNDCFIGITKPEGVELTAFINDMPVGIHHVHAKAGDSIHFIVKGLTDSPKSVLLDYAGSTSSIQVPAAYSVSANEYSEEKSNSTNECALPKGNNMGLDNVNLFTQPSGYGNNGDSMGGLATIALLGGLNNRRDNNDDNCDAAKVAVMTAGFDGVNHNINTALQGTTNQLNTGFGGQRDLTLMNKLGQIEADVWKAEGQVQLALAGAQADVNRNINTGIQMSTAGQIGISKNITDATAMVVSGQGDIKQAVLSSAGILGSAISQTRYDVTTAVRDDGDKTRALIVSQNDAMLNRELAVAQGALLEERAAGRARATEVNVTQTVTQNQAQLQQQAQQQQQFLVTNNLLQAILSQAQIAQATNQSLIIGNSGDVRGGNQTANPTNVRA